MEGLLRCGKSCRLRWLNYLRPGIKRGNITSEEEDLIIRLQSLLGNRWSLIAGRLPGRTDNEIKNHWNTHILKRLKQQGIHPKPNNNHISKKGKSKIIKKDDVENQVVYLPKPRRVSVSAARFTRSYDESFQLGSVGSSSQLQEQPRPRAAEVDDVSGDNNDNNISWDSFDYDLALQDYTMLNDVYDDFLHLL